MELTVPGKPYLEIASRLRDRMRSGDLRPNQQLASQNVLAREFGVSTATVQRALRELEREGLIWSQQGKGRFVAISQSRPRAWTIGVILFDLEHLVHPVASQRLAGIRDEVGPAGYHLVTFAINDQAQDGNGPDGEPAWPSSLDNMELDGIIVVAQEADAEMARQPGRNTPSVWLDAPFTGRRTANVSLDHVGGGFAAAKHLLDLGHGRIAFVGPSPETYRLAGEQLDGIRLGFRTAPSSGAELLTPTAAGYTEVEGLRIGRELLHGEPQVSAVICASDDIAAGVCRACAEAGARIPHDVSVIGWNDTLGPEVAGVPMTTVEMPFREAAREGARLLLAMIEAESVAGIGKRVETRLVVRGSTDPPRS